MSVTVPSTWKVYHISALLDKSVLDILESSGTGAVPGADTEDMLTSATHILVKHEAPTSASQRVAKHHAGRSPTLHSRCGTRICCRTAADTGSASGSRHEAGCRNRDPAIVVPAGCYIPYGIWQSITLYCELGPALGLKSCYAQLELPSTIMDHVPRARQYKSGNVHLLHLVKSLCSNCRLRCLLSLLNRFLSSYDWHRDTNATAIMTSTALGICPYI